MSLSERNRIISQMLASSPAICFYYKKLIMDLYEDEEDECDVAVQLVLQTFGSIPRVSIPNYFEDVVPMYSEEEFVRAFRLSRSVFENLADAYDKSAIHRKIASQHLVTSSRKSLAIFLWFSGHECMSYHDLSNLFNIAISTVHSVLRRVISFVSSLSPSVITWPSSDEMKEEAEYHSNKTGIPGIVGAVDGTHVRIDPPANKKDEYIDRKGQVTLLIQAVCNNKNKFTHVSMGYPGSVHDARAFRCSILPEQLTTIPQGFYILGDSAYPCSTKLLTPYKDNGHLTAAQKHFNYSLSSSRVQIEHSFGILKQRFRQLYYCKLKGIKTLCHFIRACFVLHNLSKVTDLDYMDGEEPPDHLQYPHDDISVGDENGKGVRDEVCRALYSKKGKK